MAKATHGTMTAYRYKCRCEACKRAAMNYRRAREGKPLLPVHKGARAVGEQLALVG